MVECERGSQTRQFCCQKGGLSGSYGSEIDYLSLVTCDFEDELPWRGGIARLRES